jgi:hypothetical protein
MISDFRQRSRVFANEQTNNNGGKIHKQVSGPSEPTEHDCSPATLIATAWVFGRLAY